MLEVTRTGGNAVGFRAVGKLTHDDYYKVWNPALREVIRLSGKARALLVLDEADEGWQHDTIWDPVRFGPRHSTDLERLAIAGNDNWHDWTETVTKHFRGHELRVYEARKQATAWGWVKA
jgi:hypothetical protein